jgi:predicted nucleic acid-binding protein
VYVDTSVLTPYYVRERGTPRAQALLRAEPRPMLSWLTEVELFSAIARKVRERSLSKPDAQEIFSLFRSQLAGGYFERLALGAQHYQLAADWIETLRSPLRSLDALHIAVASVEGLPIATADRGLARAAKIFGVKVVTV